MGTVSCCQRFYVILCATILEGGGTRRNMKCMLVVSAVLIWCLITIHVQFYIFITIKNSTYQYTALSNFCKFYSPHNLANSNTTNFLNLNFHTFPDLGSSWALAQSLSHAPK